VVVCACVYRAVVVVVRHADYYVLVVVHVVVVHIVVGAVGCSSCSSYSGGTYYT
jgi:hypothetical protein